MIYKAVMRIGLHPIFAKVGLALAILCLVLSFTLPRVIKNPADGVEWASVPIWLNSASCARKTDVFLVLCKGDKIVPISDKNFGEDPGHALMLGLYSMFTGNTAYKSGVPVINSCLNAFGIAMLALLMVAIDLNFAAFAVIILGGFVAAQFNSETPHPAQLGAACLAAIFPIVILARPRLLWLWIVIGIFCLALCSIFRQSIGMMGLMTTLIVATLRLYRNKWRGAVASAALIIAGLLAYQSPYFLLRARDAIYNVPPTKMLERHGAWHSLYIGLGVVDNPFGLAWNDGIGDAAAKRVNPDVIFGSKAYYDILRSLYLDLVLSHPVTVLHIYLEKLVIAFWEPLPTGMPLGYLIIIIAMFAPWGRFREGVQSTTIAKDAVLVVSAIFIAMYLAQAMLIHFSMQYLFPVQIFLILCTGVLIEYMFSSVRVSRYGSLP